MGLARAKYLDDYLAEHKKPIGPLHGLPISVKDQVRIKVRPLFRTKVVMSSVWIHLEDT